jgi:IS5 family transposase
MRRFGPQVHLAGINVAEALFTAKKRMRTPMPAIRALKMRCERSAVRWHVAMRPGKRRQLD